MKQEAAEATAGRRQSCPGYSAREKAEAVLALWSGRRNPSALTKALRVPWSILNGWEKRALSGMLGALDPAWRQGAQEQPRLPRRVERLIEQTVNPATPPAANG